MSKILSDATADDVLRMLRSRELPPQRKGGVFASNIPVIVRCDDVTAIGTGWAEQFFPGTIVQVASDILYPATQAIDIPSMLGMSVLLTVLGDSLGWVSPKLNKCYLGVLTGDVEAETTTMLKGRPRVIAVDDSAGSTTPSTWKSPGVRLVATAALPANSYSNGSAGVGATLTGTSNGAITTQDAVTMLVNDDLLVTAEGVPSHNGIYTLTQVGDAGHPYILTRRADANLAALMPDATVYVREGQSYFNTTFQCTVEPPLTMGGTDLPWVLLNGARTGSDPVNTSNIGPFSDGVWTGGLTPYSCQLPGAGIYTICGCVCGTGLLSAAGSQEAIISVRLTDGTAPLRGTKQVLLSIRDTKQISDSVSFAAPYTSTGVKTISIEAIRSSFGATWSLGWPSVGPGAGDRETWLEYIRHR